MGLFFFFLHKKKIKLESVLCVCGIFFLKARTFAPDHLITNCRIYINIYSFFLYLFECKPNQNEFKIVRWVAALFTSIFLSSIFKWFLFFSFSVIQFIFWLLIFGNYFMFFFFFLVMRE